MAQTWWFVLSVRGESVPLAVTTESVEDAASRVQHQAEHFTAPIMSGPTPFAEFSPCQTCSYAEPCQASCWDSPRRLGGPDWTFESWSNVHTCPVCMERVIDFHKGPLASQRNTVPPTCPRWSPVFGSAMHCSGCQVERDALRASHPRFKDGLEAAKRLLDTMLETIRDRQELGPEVERLDTVRNRKTAVGDLVATWDPFPTLREASDSDTERPRLVLATTLLGNFWEMALKHPSFKEEALQAPEQDLGFMIGDWMEGMYLALRRHEKDPEGLVHEWLLLMTDKPVAMRAWVRLPIPGRKLLIRGWEKAARDALS